MIHLVTFLTKLRTLNACFMHQLTKEMHGGKLVARTRLVMVLAPLQV